MYIHIYTIKNIIIFLTIYCRIYVYLIMYIHIYMYKYIHVIFAGMEA